MNNCDHTPSITPPTNATSADNPDKNPYVIIFIKLYITLTNKHNNINTIIFPKKIVINLLIVDLVVSIEKSFLDSLIIISSHLLSG